MDVKTHLVRSRKLVTIPGNTAFSKVVSVTHNIMYTIIKIAITLASSNRHQRCHAMRGLPTSPIKSKSKLATSKTNITTHVQYQYNYTCPAHIIYIRVPSPSRRGHGNSGHSFSPVRSTASAGVCSTMAQTKGPSIESEIITLCFLTRRTYTLTHPTSISILAHALLTQ